MYVHEQLQPDHIPAAGSLTASRDKGSRVMVAFHYWLYGYESSTTSGRQGPDSRALDQANSQTGT